MTDNEIIVPLKCLVMNESDCRHCKLKDKNDKCQKFLYSDVLGLIDENNRQKAEIERLTADVKTMESVIKRSFVEAAGFDIDPLAEIKGEAVREFAERLKENLIEESYDDCQFFKVVGESEIDNLVKEMVGVESGN